MRGGERFDFVFIDGRHLFDCVLVDFFYVDRLLEIGGYLALDDLWMPAVRKVKSKALPDWQQMVWQRVRRVGRFMLKHRLGREVRSRITPANIAFLRKTAEDSRRWDFHQPF